MLAHFYFFPLLIFCKEHNLVQKIACRSDKESGFFSILYFTILLFPTPFSCCWPQVGGLIELHSHGVQIGIQDVLPLQRSITYSRRPHAQFFPNWKIISVCKNPSTRAKIALGHQIARFDRTKCLLPNFLFWK